MSDSNLRGNNMQDDVQPQRPVNPQGPQTSSTATGFSNDPNNSALGGEPVGPAIVEPTPVVPEKKPSNTKWILGIVVALLIGGIVGYSVGTSMAESSAESQYSAKITQLESDLKEAKAGVTSKIEAGKDAIAEGQDTLESVQAENAKLQATITELEADIAALEKQLKEALADNPPASTN